jgi:hypothetical protein
MSWDVMIFNFGGKTLPRIGELKESDCEPLGPAAEIRRKVTLSLAGIDWLDPTWGLYQGTGFSVEFNLGRDDLIRNMMLHVRGSGDAISAITEFASPLGWSAFDCSTGEYLDLQNPSQAGWKGFQEYRDKVVKQYGDETRG